jgi:hypothetical protein
MDRRRDPRFTLEASVDFAWMACGEQHMGRGKTRDISLHGLFVFSDVCPPAGTEMRLNVTLPLAAGGLGLVLRAKVATVARVDPIGHSAPQTGFAAIAKKYRLERVKASVAVAS